MYCAWLSLVVVSMVCSIGLTPGTYAIKPDVISCFDAEAVLAFAIVQRHAQ
jgi:hypothetical protein